MKKPISIFERNEGGTEDALLCLGLYIIPNQGGKPEYCVQIQHSPGMVAIWGCQEAVYAEYL